MNFLRTCLRILIQGVLLIITIILFVLAIGIAYSKYVIEVGDPHVISPSDTRFSEIGNGEEIAYQLTDNDAATTIVFVGGLSGWSGTWKRTIDSLDQSLKKEGVSYNLLAIDLPPFGYSKVDYTRGYYRDTQADRINAFRESMRLKSVVFVAHSYGAGPVTEAVMRKPEGVRKLIVVDGVLNIGETKGEYEKSLLMSDFVMSNFVSLVSHATPLIKKQLGSFVYKRDHIDDDLTRLYIQPFRQRGNGQKTGRWISDYVRDPLGYLSTKKEEYEKLSVPVRVVWGVEDTVTPLKLGEELNGLVPDSKLLKLEGVGHIPMIEDYEKSDSAILNSILN